MKTLLSTCAHMSQSVYQLKAPAGFLHTDSQPFVSEETDTAGLHIETKDRLYIVVVGSESRQDWLNDFKIKKKKCFGWFKAHRGFSECAESVIDQCVKFCLTSEKPIVVTGHSLGGAVALLIAIGLQSQQLLRGRKITLITFGQPRVSRKNLIREAFSGRYLRVQNGSDAVPRHPWLGYSHAGTCVYLSNGQGFCVDPGHTEKLLDRLFTIKQHHRATDHFMSDYIANLKRIRLFGA